MNIAITGASGNIGGMVARHLNARGLPLILPLRNPAKAPDLPNTEARQLAYGDFELAKQALNGVDVLFMVSAAESPTREQEHLTLVQAASEAGVQHIVYLSFAQAALDSTFTLARPIGRLKPGFPPTPPLPKANLPPFQTTCRNCWNVSRAALSKWLKVYLPKERQTAKV